MAIKIQGNTVIFDDESFRIGSGTTAERPADPEVGRMRFNTDTNFLEIYDGNQWDGVSLSDNVVDEPIVSVEFFESVDITQEATISTTLFSFQGAPGLTHQSTDWEVRRTSDNALIFSSYEDTTNLLSIDVPSGTLPLDTELVFRARHVADTGQFSTFGSVIETTPVLFDAPESFGNASQGGFYIGTTEVNSTCYYLIVAPNATGCTCCQWKTTQSASAGTCSLDNGFANTYTGLNNEQHPAGNWTATRTINGFSDWYLPSRDELNQLYVNDGGATNTTLPAGEGFAAASYWSSTENFIVSNTDAYCQCFLNCSINRTLKTSCFCVRAVRRFPFI